MAAGALLLPRSPLPRGANAQRIPYEGLTQLRVESGPESARYGRVHVAVRTEPSLTTYVHSLSLSFSPSLSLSLSLPLTLKLRGKAARARFSFRGSHILPPPPPTTTTATITTTTISKSTFGVADVVVAGTATAAAAAAAADAADASPLAEASPETNPYPPALSFDQAPLHIDQCARFVGRSIQRALLHVVNMLSRPKSHGVGHSDWAPAARASAESHAAYESDRINMYQGMRLVCDRMKKAPADRELATPVACLNVSR